MANISLNPFQEVQNPRGFINGIEPGSIGNPINTIFSGATDSFALNAIAGLTPLISNFSSFIPSGFPIQGIGNAITNVSQGFAQAFSKLNEIQNQVQSQIQSLIPNVSTELTSAISSSIGLPTADALQISNFTNQFSESFSGYQEQLGSVIGGPAAQLGSVFSSVQLGGVSVNSNNSLISGLQSAGPAMEAVQSVERLEQQIASLTNISNTNAGQQLIQTGNTDVIRQAASASGRIPSVTGTSVNIGRIR